MTEEQMQALCNQAVERIHAIPFSDWPEPGLLADVLYEVFAPMLAAKDAEIAELRHELARLRDCVGAEDVELIDAVLGER